jgi:hypothetical protein
LLKAQLLLTEREMQAVQTRQELIIYRLNHLELLDNMPDYEVTVKPVEALAIAAIRETVPEIKQMPSQCGEMFRIGYFCISGRGFTLERPLQTLRSWRAL